ncbi:MAG: ribokinase [Clostridia bacterium]|nr:ribokinase [Clostridia bacterium]
MKKRILVVSSANMDFVMNVSTIPEAGETLLESTGDYRFIPGGKGGNSAIAVQRLGGDCVFCAKLGRDQSGATLRQLYQNEGVNVTYMRSAEGASTGLAAIIVEENGDNRITVFPGANDCLTADDAEEALLCYPDAVLLHFEIPNEAILSAAKYAAKQGAPIFIDAGPAKPDFPFDQLPELEVFSPNEQETEAYTGIYPATADLALKAAIRLEKMVKAKYYVIKLGDRGALVYDKTYYKIADAYSVRVVDTTAAGDGFTAALTLEYIRTGNIMHACRYANAVGAMIVSKNGASTSIPNEAQLAKFVEMREIKL